ncbi:MAG: SGNH/GDSL hydrolase family protein [Anaerolineae bacterium]|nr:SGNH/GDSL hydrolase family protein [Anaerolineae bacterium]
MKTILCYGDSNTWGCPPMTDFNGVPRYGTDIRWGSVLRTALGRDYWVIEEGLNGRTTVWDDPVEGEYRNGKTYLYPCLRSHAPLDLVIVMLGTNDLKTRFNLTPYDIASGAGSLVDLIQRSESGINGTAPQVLLICPPPVAKLTLFADMFAGAEAKSRQLAPHYQRIAQAHDCAFLDAGTVITSSDRDGIHFEPEEQQKLGHAVAAKVRQLLA